MEYEKACDSNNLFLKQRNELGRYSPLHTSKRQCPISAELKESIALLSIDTVFCFTEEWLIFCYFSYISLLLLLLDLIYVRSRYFHNWPVPKERDVQEYAIKTRLSKQHERRVQNILCKLRLRFCADKSLIYIYQHMYFGMIVCCIMY